MRVRVAWPGRPATLTVDVSDSGIGLTAAQTAPLFAPFQQGDAARSRCASAAAVSAWRCRGASPRASAAPSSWRARARRRHHVSRHAAGADRPRPDTAVADRRRAPAGADASSPASACSSPTTTRDIREPIMELLAALRRRRRRRPRTASTAVQLALGGSFDVVLMDVRMPDLDGLEARAACARRGALRPDRGAHRRRRRGASRASAWPPAATATSPSPSSLPTCSRSCAACSAHFSA